MKTVFLIYVPWVLVLVLALALAVVLTLLAYLFGFLMSGAWYRWKHRGALFERNVLFEVRKLILEYETTETGELPALVCKDAIAMIDKALVP